MIKNRKWVRTWYEHFTQNNKNNNENRVWLATETERQLTKNKNSLNVASNSRKKSKTLWIKYIDFDDTKLSICSLNFFFLSFVLRAAFFYPNKRPCFSRWLYHFSYINLKRADENRLLRQMRNGTTPKNQRTDSKRTKKYAVACTCVVIVPTEKRFAARTHNLSTFLCNLRLVAFHLTTAYYFILSLYGLISVVSSFFRLQFNIETYVSVLIAFLPFGLVLRR